MRAFYTDHPILPLPSGHWFPMRRYNDLRTWVLADVPELSIQGTPQTGNDALLLTHTFECVEVVNAGRLSSACQWEIGSSWSPGMVERSRRSADTTTTACDVTLADDIAVNLTSGTYCTYVDKGDGFCVFSGATITSRWVQRQFDRTPGDFPVAIVDLDVRQGSDMASILCDDATVFTLSLHGEKNYPFRKEAPDLGVDLYDGCGDEDYLQVLTDTLDILTGRSKPQLIICLAGTDLHGDDRLDRLEPTLQGLARRNQEVFDLTYQRCIPVAVIMASGYGNGVDDTVTIHAQIITLAAHHTQRWAARDEDASASTPLPLSA